MPTVYQSGAISSTTHILECALPTARQQAAHTNAIYEAQFGILPDDICWSQFGYDGYSSFENGALVIDSGTNLLDFHSYMIEGPAKLVSPLYDPGKENNKPWIIEANAKYGPGATNHTARAHMQVTFSPFPDLNLMNALQIGQDEFFLLSDPLTRGDTAIRDTDDDYHTYRIEVRYDDVTENDWVIEVYYDNEATPAITGSLVDWSPYGSFPMRIYFGDHTGSGYGISYWKSVKFNFLNGVCATSLP